MEGSSAVASTKMPMPPSQWVKARHRRMPLGRDSMSVRMVAPVVVKPELASKIQSQMVLKPPPPLKKKGSPPATPVNSQMRPTVAKPSRRKKELCVGRKDRGKLTHRMIAILQRNGAMSSP